jgi:prepilin signal peptidase PulO-like enzyme (type II secretory pathway)
MSPPVAPAAGLVLAASAACALCDARTGRIPNLITYPTFALLLLLGIWRGDIAASLAGAAAGGGVLLLLHLATAGRGLGLGDVKLGACIGAGLGAGDGLIAIGTAFIAGACAGIIFLALRRARRGDRIAFGPYLALGTFLATAAAFKW